MAGLVLSLGSFAACDWSSSPTPSTPPTQPRPAAKPKPPAAKPKPAPTPTRGASATQPKVDWIERQGLRYLVKPKAVKVGGGWGLSIDVVVQAADNNTHVVYGYAKGLALSGVRFGNMNGMMPLSESGKVQRFGRVRPGTGLTLKREFPGKGTGWTPLRKGDSLVLSLKSWASKGNDAVASPTPVDIAGVTLTINDDGRPEVEVQKSKG